MCGKGWLTGNAGWDQKSEPSRPDLGLYSAAGGEELEVETSSPDQTLSSAASGEPRAGF